MPVERGRHEGQPLATDNAWERRRAGLDSRKARAGTGFLAHLVVLVRCLEISFWRGARVAEGNGLLNRRRESNSYRGFESPPLR